MAEMPEGKVMEYKRKYMQDFCRCSGENCSIAEKCARHDAIVEARDLDLHHGCYLDSKECIKSDYVSFLVIEVVVSE